MLLETSSKIGAEAVAVMTGAFLSGGMMNISMMIIPVLLDTAGDPFQLVDQWARVYYYGLRTYPAIAVTTSLLYAYAAFNKRAAGSRWLVFAMAGVTTLSMPLFTFGFMLGTNNALFRVQTECRAGQEASLEEVRNLLLVWNTLHFTRSLLPVVGAVLGLLGTFGVLVF